MRSGSAQRFLDVEELATRRAVVAGFVEAKSMLRLLDIVAEAPRPIAYRIEFTRDASRRPKMVGRVDGMLSLVCQRCLDDLDWWFDMTFESLVVADDREEADGRDVVVCPDGRIALEPTIEEELLLAMPHAPVHPHGTCGIPPIRMANEGSSSFERHPFSALRTLRSLSRRGREGSN